jgi:hypothetical protein
LRASPAHASVRLCPIEAALEKVCDPMGLLRVVLRTGEVALRWSRIRRPAAVRLIGW